MKSFRCFLFIFFCSTLSVISGKGCEENPCLNGGLCQESPGHPGYECQCQPDFVGQNCALPAPEINCGKKAIEIRIDERIIEEMQLPMEEKFIYFDQSPGCRAVRREKHFHLRVDAPFVDCGLNLQAQKENFVFSQKVIWNSNEGLVERPVVIVDFKCSYSGKYNVSFDAIKPTVTTVDFSTTYGRFTLQMDLFKSQTFDDKFSLRPVVAVNEEVCVKNLLSGSLPSNLVLTTLRCWASGEGDDEVYDIIQDRCLADPSNSLMINNGNSDEMKFCFNVFKWKDSLNAAFIHCKVQVCNSTTNNCECPIVSRNKRDVIEEGVVEEGESNSAEISSPKILIVESRYLENWLDFLETDSSAAGGEQLGEIDDYDIESERPESNQRTVLLAIGIILVLVIVGLGVLVGVVVSYTKKKSSKKPAKTDQTGYDVFA